MHNNINTKFIVILSHNFEILKQPKCPSRGELYIIYFRIFIIQNMMQPLKILKSLRNDIEAFPEHIVQQKTKSQNIHIMNLYMLKKNKLFV